MKKPALLFLVFLTAVAIMFTFSFKPATSLPGQILTDQSKVTFSVSHLGTKVKGTLKGMQGTVDFHPNNLPGSRMQVSIDAGTIDTDNSARDSDLRKDKFFHISRYPQISFRSKEITRNEERYLVRGDLTIKDKTREVVIPFTHEVMEGKGVFKGVFTINRKDFDLGKSGFPPIGKDVDVKITAVVM